MFRLHCKISYKGAEPVSHVCVEMMSVCSVRVIDPNIRQQVWSLYRVTTFPDPHSALWVSLPHPPSPPPAPLRCDYCPPKLSHWLQTVRNSNQPKTHTFIWRCGTIYRRDEASRNQIHSTQRTLQHRDPAMTPKIISARTYSEEHLTLTNKVNWRPNVTDLHQLLNSNDLYPCYTPESGY